MPEFTSFPAVSLRAITPEDAEFLLAQYKRSRGDDLRGLGWDEQRISEFLEMQYEAHQRFHASEYKKAVDQVVLRGTETVGRVIFEPREHEIRCVEMALLPGHRNVGIGTRLIRE